MAAFSNNRMVEGHNGGRGNIFSLDILCTFSILFGPSLLEHAKHVFVVVVVATTHFVPQFLFGICPSVQGVFIANCAQLCRSSGTKLKNLLASVKADAFEKLW